jgi:hypothetical protein
MRKHTPARQVSELHDEARAAAELLLDRMKRKKIPGLSSLKRIFVVEQNRGQARLDRDAITIPAWCFRCKDSTDMVLYYVAHEMAHFFAYYSMKRSGNKSLGSYMSMDTGHGLGFFKWFKKICPKEWWRFELDYYPMSTTHRTALIESGIMKPGTPRKTRKGRR